MNPERTTKSWRLWLPCAALLALGACATDDAGPAKPAPVTPSERYSIEVKQAPVELKLATHSAGLSAAQVDALRDLAGRWADADQPEISVRSPAHGPDQAGAYRTATDARDYLIAQGVPAGAVHIVGYDAGGDDKAPIVVGFMHYVATGPTCGQSWDDVAKVLLNNEAYTEFGCAVTANIAAEIADPADILHPRTETAPDPSRRQTVLDKYRLGTVTSTAKDDQANGSVSSVGQ